MTEVPHKSLPPIPVLTIEQLQRDLVSLREIVKLRLDQMDKANEIQSASTPSALYAGMFESIQNQFEERELRYQTAESAARIALATALEAQKEAATALTAVNAAALRQSENFVEKHIDNVMSHLTASTKALEDKIVGINGRLDRVEHSRDGVTKTMTQAIILAVAAIVIALIIGGFSITQHTLQTPITIQR